MLETETPGDKMRAPQWAILLCATLLVAFAGVALFSLRDRTRISAIERWDETAGVGDKLFFTPPAALDPKSPVAAFGRSPLYAQSVEPAQLSDSLMMKAGLDDSRKFFVYYNPTAVPAAGAVGRAYFLKINNGQYLPVSTVAK